MEAPEPREKGKGILRAHQQSQSECLCPPKNSYVETYSPNAVLLGGEAFGR